MTLNLCNFPKPHKSKLPYTKVGHFIAEIRDNALKKTSETFIQVPENEAETVYLNLFHVKRVSGFFPFTKTEPGYNCPVAAVRINMFFN